MRIQEIVRTELIDFAKNYYKNQGYPFYRESDIVWVLQKKLATALKGTNYSVFHEYPVEPVVPLKIPKGKIDEIREQLGEQSWIEESYSYDGSNYYLKENQNFSSLKSAFKSLYEEGIRFEAFYMDLAIVKPDPYKTDLETIPEIIIEFKYEADSTERNDFRKNRTRRINNRGDIEKDIEIIRISMGHSQIKCGFFVFVDEANSFPGVRAELEMENWGNNVWVKEIAYSSKN